METANVAGSEGVYHFPAGLPAFETHKEFRLEQPPDLAPLVFLGSTSDPSLRFVCVPPAALIPDYAYHLEEEDARVLGVRAGPRQAAGDPALVCLVIVTLPPGEVPRANLIAPVLFAVEKRVALQAIQAFSAYSPFHPLRPAQPGEDACS